jgi:hypothetical protein
MIPEEMKEKIRKIIESFNLELTDLTYIFNFQDNMLFIYQKQHERITLFSKLTYVLESDKWSCFIFNYEINDYELINYNHSENAISYVLQLGLNKKENTIGGKNA